MTQLPDLLNPMVVKALRAKTRKGRMLSTLIFYLVLLILVVWLIGQLGSEGFGYKWARFCFALMMGFQVFSLTILALITVFSSMALDVNTRTLDMQRIASISPAQIIMGKVLGEPVQSYIVLSASLPLAAVLMWIGGISPAMVGCLYVSAVTTIFLAGSFGSLHSLEVGERGKASVSGGAIGFLFFLLMIQMGIAAFGPGVPRAAAIPVGLLVPIFPLMEVGWGDEWSNQMPFLGLTIPYAILFPFAQVGLALFLIRSMTRKLKCTSTTFLSKTQSYVALVVLDILTAGALFDPTTEGQGLDHAATCFAVLNTLFGVLLLLLSTPSRPHFLSWVWRCRGKRHPRADLLVGERSLHWLAIVVYCLIGGAVFVFLVAVPAWVSRPEDLAATDWSLVIRAMLASALIVLAYGFLFQVIALTSSPRAAVFFFILIVAFAHIPVFIGAYYRVPWLVALTSAGALSSIIENPSELGSLVPFCLLHVGIAAFCLWSIFRISKNLARWVDRKLAEMGVLTQMETALK